jgi:hypothetical protein
MLKFRTKQKGQAIMGGILLLVLLIGITIFIFYMIKRPSGGGPVSEAEETGLSIDAIQKAAADIQATDQKFPVAQVLPYGGPFDGALFFIHTPLTDGTILVDIDSNSAVGFDTTKELALQWIRDQGYDPGQYNFTFRSRTFNY